MDWMEAEKKVKDCSDVIKSHVFFVYTLCGFHLNGLSYSQYLERSNKLERRVKY